MVSGLLVSPYFWFFSFIFIFETESEDASPDRGLALGMRSTVRGGRPRHGIARGAEAAATRRRLIGETVQIIVADGVVRIVHAGKEVARHGLLSGKRQHAIDPVHFEGVAGANGRPMLASRSCGPPAPNGGSAGPQLLRPSELLRPLSEYEAIAGGGW